MKKLLLASILLIATTSLFSQRDLHSWAGMKLETKIDDKTKFGVKPIIRHTNDISTYQNASIEFYVNRKLGDKWFAQHLYRHWIWPDQVRVNFLWFDVGYNTSLSSAIKSTTAARLHWSITDERQAADFIRVREKLTFGKGKIRPNIQFEIWWRLDGNTGFSRTRLEPGLSWIIGDGYSFGLTYRIQTDTNGLMGTADHLVSSLNYSF